MEDIFQVVDGSLVLRLNSNLYTKDVLFHAAYVLVEDFYFHFDIEGDYYVVRLTPKKKYDEDGLKNLGNIFLEELVESKGYIDQMSRTAGIRETLLQRALMTQSGGDVDFEDIEEEISHKEWGKGN